MPFELDVVDGAQGSCRYSEGDTVALATATGPQHVMERASSQDPARGGLEVRVQLADRGVADRVLVERRLEEQVSGILAHALDLASFPRQLATVYCLVVLDAGAAARCVLNACVMALLDARLPLVAVPLGVDVVRRAARPAGDGGERPEAAATTTSVTMDASSAAGDVLALDTAGEPFDATDLRSVLTEAATAVAALKAAAVES